MIILGIDPGLTRCGYAVVDGRGNGAATAVSLGVIRTPASRALVFGQVLEQTDASVTFAVTNRGVLPLELGVPTLAYAPYAFVNLMNPVIAIIYGITHFKITPIEEAERA